MKNKWIIFCILWCLLLLLLLYQKQNSDNINLKNYKKCIDSLELIIINQDILKDSIQNEIDTVYIKIKDNSIKHETMHNIIINNSISNDYIFFLEYLTKNRSRLDSINNF